MKSSLRRGSARHGKLLTLRLNTTVPQKEDEPPSITQGLDQKESRVAMGGGAGLLFFGLFPFSVRERVKLSKKRKKTKRIDRDLKTKYNKENEREREGKKERERGGERCKDLAVSRPALVLVSG